MAARALQLVHSQPAEAVLLHDWSRAVWATYAWSLWPSLDSYLLARATWRRVEGDWLRLLAGRR
jgi:hypothetical protein